MSEQLWDDPRITSYVLGELPADELAAFEKELDSNPELDDAVRDARRVTDQLQDLYAGEPTQTLDTVRRSEIVSPDGDAASTPHPPSRSWKLPLVLLATAAALLLLVGAPLMFPEERTTVGQLSEPLAPVSESETESLGVEVGEPSQSPLAIGLEKYERSANAGVRPAVESELGSALNKKRHTRPSSPPSPSQGLGDNAATQARPMLMTGGESQSDLRSRSVAVDPSSQPTPSSQPASAEKRTLGASMPAVVTGRDQPMLSKNPVAREHAIDESIAEKQTHGRQHAGRLVERKGKANKEASSIIASEGKSRPGQVAANESFDRVSSPFGIPIAGSVPTDGGRGFDRGRGFGRDPGPGLEFGSGLEPSLGHGPGHGPRLSGDRFEPITDNPFKRVSEHPLSTFSVDVDTASYSKTRDFLMRANQLPRPDAVRIEELVNYFDYEYAPPKDDAAHPFAARAMVTACPWNEGHRLARISLKGKTMGKDERPPCNLVFLLDTSGSMNARNKLPLVIEGMQMLVKELNNQDRVAITVYAGSAGLVLDSTSAKKGKKIRKALTQLSAGGSTNGGAGIALAYQTARDNFIEEGVNRVILCTDGDFNVGATGTDQLVRMVEKEAKGGIFLSVLGFGMGNHNDAMLEQISGRGNGNYAFIDTQNEARKVLVDQTSGTLVTIAKDVKLQVEFNPSQVSSYRLIGYENRILAKEDFNDDQKDAGEIGAGHTVTALYEIVPAGMEADASGPEVDALKYQTEPKPNNAADSNEMLTLKLRYKQPDSDISTLVEFPVTDEGGEFQSADHDVRFAAAVASFGMQLRRSEYAGTWTMSDVLAVAEDSKGEDEHGLRAEFVELVRKAAELMGQQ